MGLVGDQFDCYNEVTGVAISVSDRHDKISVWIRHGHEQEVRDRVRADIIRICELPPDVRLDFLLFFPHAKHQDHA